MNFFDQMRRTTLAAPESLHPDGVHDLTRRIIAGQVPAAPTPTMTSTRTTAPVGPILIAAVSAVLLIATLLSGALRPHAPVSNPAGSSSSQLPPPAAYASVPTPRRDTITSGGTTSRSGNGVAPTVMGTVDTDSRGCWTLTRLGAAKPIALVWPEGTRAETTNSVILRDGRTIAAGLQITARGVYFPTTAGLGIDDPLSCVTTYHPGDVALASAILAAEPAPAHATGTTGGHATAQTLLRQAGGPIYTAAVEGTAQLSPQGCWLLRSDGQDGGAPIIWPTGTDFAGNDTVRLTDGTLIHPGDRIGAAGGLINPAHIPPSSDPAACLHAGTQTAVSLGAVHRE